MPSPVTQLEFAANLGLTLLKVQNTEIALKACLTWLGLDPQTMMDALDSPKSKVKVKMLGELISEFKKHIAPQNGFEIALQEMRQKRNVMVHNFRSVPGFTLETEEGISVGIEFLRTLRNQADLVTGVVMGLNQMALNPDQTLGDLTDLTPEKQNHLLSLMMLKPKD